MSVATHKLEWRQLAGCRTLYRDGLKIGNVQKDVPDSCWIAITWLGGRTKWDTRNEAEAALERYARSDNGMMYAR